jgi:hypothetical protein
MRGSGDGGESRSPESGWACRREMVLEQTGFDEVQDEGELRMMELCSIISDGSVTSAPIPSYLVLTKWQIVRRSRSLTLNYTEGVGVVSRAFCDRSVTSCRLAWPLLVEPVMLCT